MHKQRHEKWVLHRVLVHVCWYSYSQFFWINYFILFFLLGEKCFVKDCHLTSHYGLFWSNGFLFQEAFLIQTSGCIWLLEWEKKKVILAFFNVCNAGFSFTKPHINLTTEDKPPFWITFFLKKKLNLINQLFLWLAQMWTEGLFIIEEK